MKTDLLMLALIVGACTWGLRYLPTRMRLGEKRADGAFGRFLSATGPAAVATLFTASILPMLAGPAGSGMASLAAGIVAVGGVFAASRSVVQATLAGSVAYGLIVAWLG